MLDVRGDEVLMPAWLADWPFFWIYVFFVVGAACRSQALYWLGRGVRAGVLRSRFGERVESPRMQRAVRFVERWGMPAVPVSFLTVGFQSAVHTSCGLLRIGWPRYTLWAVPGWFAWALIWAGGGTAALVGAFTLFARSPWALVAVAVVVVAVATVLVLRGRRRRAEQDAIEHLAQEAHRS